MPNHATETHPPPGSRIAAQLEGAHFYDAWCISCPATPQPALGYFLHAASLAPRWIDLCMQARNRAGGLVGLKNLGKLSRIDPSKPANAYQRGERVGIFTVIDNQPGEALLGDSDKHLDVVLSVHRAPLGGDAVTITVTTVVHVKNWLGHMYMLPVRPMHRLITPAVLSRLPRPAI